MITIVPVGLIDYVWSEVEPLLIQAELGYEPGDRANMPEVKGRLLMGDYLLWVIASDSIVATGIFTKKGSDFVMLTVGGERMDEWIDEVILTAETMAKNFGCAAVTNNGGRKGWSRVLKKHGFADRPIISYKTVE